MAVDLDAATRQAFEELGREYHTYGGGWSARVNRWLAAGLTVPDAAVATLRCSVLVSYLAEDLQAAVDQLSGGPALLLAEDTAITDPTITSQIRRG